MMKSLIKEYITMQHKNELVKWYLEKSDIALNAAKDNIKLNHLDTAQNRIYYAIFYIVSTLAMMNGFATAKHKQLMGWFNKKFIYEDKIFDKNMFDIYKDAYLKRQKSDYEKMFYTTKEDVEELLDKAIVFTDTLKEYILKEIKNETI